MPLLVDGHNLLHCIRKTCEDFESITDVRLCQLVDKFLRLTREKGKIVFDGAGPRDKAGFEGFRDLEVIFAGLGGDADTMIEQKISANTAPRRLTIVSSDRRLRAAARSRKATLLKSEMFWEQVQKQLSRKRPEPEPGQKRIGLSEGETEQWLKFFGLEE
jgi:predicted RNA-binding protein with PIN domain